jgi:hypothetical protein
MQQIDIFVVFRLRDYKITIMTDIAIEQQIKSIEKATKKAARTKESARKFLSDAGIIGVKKTTSTLSESKKNK